jgi:16S rRNA (cytosine967-C5)-methyltransferase
MAQLRDERLLCCEILGKVLARQGSLASYLTAELRQRQGLNFALLQEYCYGVCRWYGTLECWAGVLLEKPLRKKDADVHCLILLGLYQLFFMRTPAHAAINETVAAAATLGKPWAKGLVNALLREAQRSEEKLRQVSDADYASKYAHPEWLLAQLKKDWPGYYRAILDANNERAPMTLRVNTGRVSREDYRARLQQAGFAAEAGALAPTALVLHSPVDVNLLPGFSEGLVSVQDEASQLLPLLLLLQQGQRVLDACAAPGGKTCALLEKEPTLSVLCLDNDSKRLPRLHENLTRCGLTATVACGDITQGLPAALAEPFDAILLDAPCSATGVIRRHPDIKLLRTVDEVRSVVVKQTQLLDAAWPLLKTGGYLMYSTCSVLHCENSDRIADFLQRHPTARELPLGAGSVPSAHGLQLLPQPLGHDGFFYALLQKW